MATTDDSGKLGEYHRKRSFDRTPEPRGRTGRTDSGHRFVIHEHHARRLHWDLRLEHEGVLVSWALPRGVPDTPEQNRLAVHTEDHPLEYLTFSGDIPSGQYGAGTMTIWDHGTYDVEKFDTDKIVVHIDGEQVRGRYALFRTDGDDWMMHRTDPPEGEPTPSGVRPMAATLTTMPADESAWGFEIKWDGVRALAYAQPGRLALYGRNGRDMTRQYPELGGLGEQLGTKRVVLDGEIVAFDDEGRPSFQQLQPRIHVSSDADIRHRRSTIPIAYVIFDVLYAAGRSLMNEPYERRRRHLDDLNLGGSNWQVPDYHAGAGRTLLEATRQQGLEGVIAKRLDSPYRPGRRSRDWLKIKNSRRQEVVIGGWTPGKGRLRASFGALLVGTYDEGRLKYAGKVGTGFDQAARDELHDELDRLHTDESPFSGRQPQKDSVFVEPALVCEVEFAQWTTSGTLRHPSFLGLRTDKDPKDVIRERPEPPPEATE